MAKRLDGLGWLVAAAIVGLMLGGAFQNRAEKVGVVDLGRVFQESDAAKANGDRLRNMSQAREDLLRFVNDNRGFTDAQLRRFRELSLKGTVQGAEKQELDRIRNEVVAAGKSFRDLTLKPNPTDAEKNQLQEFNRRSQTAIETARQWAQEFDQELTAEQEKLRTETLDRAKAAVREVAQRQGFTLVFVQDIAPFSANDLTDASLKAMNAKRN